MTETTDAIMALADTVAVRCDRYGIEHAIRARAALRAAVERVIAENLQRGNVIGRITAHLLGNKNNVTDEDAVIAAAEVGRELHGAIQRAERAERERDEARALLNCTATNLEKGMSKSVQRMQAQTIRAELKAAAIRAMGAKDE